MNYLMWRYFALFFGMMFLGESPVAWCQERSFRHFSVADGLPNYSVLSLTQDQTGFLWLGTTAGLCRYDGVRFKIYRNDGNDTTSISGGHITSLLTGRDGTLWVGTSMGLDRYDAAGDKFERISFHGSRVGNIFKVYEDSKGKVWVGTENGLYYITESGERRSFDSKISGNIVKGIFEDSKGRLWIGTDQGLNCLEVSGESYRVSNFRPFPPGEMNQVTSIAEDARQMLWIGTQVEGLCSFDPENRIFTTYRVPDGLINNHIRCITPTRDEKLWIGTQEGISILDPLQLTFESISRKPENPHSLSQNSVYAIFQDTIGSMWVGTYFGGVNISYAYTATFSVIREGRNSINNNVVSGITDDGKGNFWIGTEGGGLNYYQRNTGTYRYYKHEPRRPASLGSNLVKSLHRDTDGNIWVGTHGGGLNVLLPDRQSFSKYLTAGSQKIIGEVSSICDDGYGGLWVASNKGLKVFSRQGTRLSESRDVSLRGQVHRFLFKDSGNVLWVFGGRGAHRIERGAIQEVDSVLVVNCLDENKEGELWGGTSGNGVIKVEGSGFRTYTNDFFQSVNIVGILCGEQADLWVSTNKGLVHYFPETGVYRVYTESDGIGGNVFNNNSCFRSSDGYYYFGGFNGITRFYPGNIGHNPHVSPLVFTRIRWQNGEVGGKSREENMTYATEVDMGYDQNTFTVDFALLNYIKSGKNVYQYRLEEYDKTWIETSEGSATYTNLAPGSYRLLVKGANNDGVWSEVKVLEIVVKPPFWLTWWAYCFYILLVGAMVFMVARFFFLRELWKREDKLHQAKLNFFTNASHEIRTHLTLIMVPVERLLTESRAEGFVYQQLTQVRANTHRLLNLVRELMDFRKAETNHLQLYARRQNLVPFLEEIGRSFRETAMASHIQMSFVHKQEVIEMNFDEKQLEKVFFNLLANAIKFTPEGGRIELYAEANAEDAVIRVTDNGRGIAPQFLPRLFTNFFQVADHGLQNTGYGIGLALSKNIVELHQGRISVESTPQRDGMEGRTVFTVILPRNIKITPVPEVMAGSNETRAVEDTWSATPAKGSHILVVEDNPEIREMIVENFSSAYRVITAENGKAGWEMAVTEIPEMVISDVMMPEMDGYQLCEKIKGDERTNHIPVILLTARSTQDEQVEGLRHGADLYLTKPFSTRVLGLSVRNLLAARDRVRQKTLQELTRLNLGKETIQPEAVSVDDLFLEKLSRSIDEHLEDVDFGVEKLAREIGMSVPVLYKKVRALTGMSVNDVVKVRRFRKAAELLVKKEISVSELAGAVGYNDRKYFAKEFKKYFGVAPGDFTASMAAQLSSLD